MASLEERFWKKVERGPGCWLWTAYKDRDGYGEIQISGRPVGAHRVSWELANGPIPEGMLVCHRCDNPACVNPSHLFLGTDADNMHDRDNKGRMKPARGPNNASASFTADQVREIRRLYATGRHTQQALANRFGVSQTTIGKVSRRVTYANVT